MDICIYLVLRALYQHPFEPLSSLSPLLLSSQLVLASAKPVSELSALSVDPACLMFGELHKSSELKGVKHLLCDENYLKINSK